MSEIYSGKYIVIEGTDGAGKSTQVELLTKHLQSIGHEIINIIEPGGTPIGQRIREILKDTTLSRSPVTNQELFTICRRELATQVIAPALIDGKYALSDRNWLSTVAYQGFAEGLSVDDIIARNQEALGKLFMPDKTVIVDVPVEVAFARQGGRGTSQQDYFEQKGAVFFENVRQGYLWAAKEFGFPVVDGSPSREIVQANILRYLGQIALL